MNHNTAITPHMMAQAATLKQDRSASKKSKKSDQSYKQILADQMNQISQACKMIGATNGKGGAQSVGASSSSATSKAAATAEKDWRRHVLKHDPIMMALYLLLMSGGGSYGYLAKIMSNLGVSMANIKKFVKDMKTIQDDVNDLMTNKSPSEQGDDAQSISDAQKDLNSLIKQYGSKLGPELIKSLSAFASPGGSLDQIISEATKGACKSWSDVVSNPDDLQKVQEYLTGPGGGAAPAGVTTIFKNMSDLMGSLNTQNQADVEKLNLTTKKVDSLTKLFAASVTMFKGLNQTLTNYSAT
ncbi:MAG: hypothetical protein S4CHLAM6_03140 [Chlamydiae bacterium]|nr:hypothetical protein [Chlamydiota bacterium]